jgi:F-type H+-transporting ATPase subunit b
MLRFQLSTFIFQLINFFILLAVLRWFLYRPLLRVMRKREEDINARLREAEERTRAVERERQSLADERQRAQADADALKGRAQEEVARQRTEMLEDARRQATKYLEDARRRAAEQERAARQLLEDEARHTAIVLAAELLEQMPVGALHHALVTQALDQGAADDSGQESSLVRALTSARSLVTVELALPADSDLEARIRRRLAELRGEGGGDLHAVFRVEPSLVAGLRILVGTVVLELSLRSILSRLEHETPAEVKRA